MAFHAEVIARLDETRRAKNAADQLVGQFGQAGTKAVCGVSGHSPWPDAPAVGGFSVPGGPTCSSIFSAASRCLRSLGPNTSSRSPVSRRRTRSM